MIHFLDGFVGSVNEQTRWPRYPVHIVWSICAFDWGKLNRTWKEKLTKKNVEKVYIYGPVDKLRLINTVDK